MFANNSYATVWEIHDKGKYSDGRISTSRKDAEGNYTTDFNAWVRFVGTAHEKAAGLTERGRIKINSCAVGNTYDKEKGVTYWNPVIFDMDDVSIQNSPNTNKPSSPVTDTDDDLPFGDDDLPM